MGEWSHREYVCMYISDKVYSHVVIYPCRHVSVMIYPYGHMSMYPCGLVVVLIEQGGYVDYISSLPSSVGRARGS